MSLQNVLDEEMIYPTEYVFPTTIEEAVELLTKWAGGARLIAGGTDMMLELEKITTMPRCLVSTEKIKGLNEIRVKDEFIEIGAAVPFTVMKNDPYLNQHVHVLTDAAGSVGSLAIQNVATLAGNIVNAMPAADGVVAAIALEAEAQIEDAEGSEWKSVESLFLGPGSSVIDPTRQLITQIRFPRFETGQGTAWYRLGRRPSMTLPILNCAVNLHFDENYETITRARIALGPVSPRPFRALEAEQYLEERPITDENIIRAAEIVQQEANPRGNILRASREYRLAVIPAMIENTLRTAYLNLKTLEGV